MCADRNRKRLNLTLPEDMIVKIKEKHSNVSRYIEGLIREDMGTAPKNEIKKKPTGQNKNLESIESVNLKELAEKESERKDKIEKAMLEFLKKHRDESWIEDTLEDKGKEFLIEEAKSLLIKHPREWSKFVSMYSENEG